MKGLLGKILPSRKLALILGGLLVLCGATGAGAVYIGADKLLGPSYRDTNGLECTEIKTVTIKRKDRFWIRKFIATGQGDGLARVKTALRVASAVYDAEKPDLVQVVILDNKGPKDRAEMRGHAVGADVVYIADPSRVPEGTNAVFTARYVDKPANDGGLFYGEKIALPEADIEKLVARLDDKSDCFKPEGIVPEGHGAPAGHGKAAPTEGHGADAATDGHGAETAPAHDAPASEAAAHETANPHGAAANAAAADAPAKDAAGPAAEVEAAAGHDAAPAQEAATEEHDAAFEPVAQGDAKSAGATWLEKFRAQPLKGASSAPTAGEMPAEDSDILPPKASAKASSEKHAEATH
ncbi:MAG TPA: hypothetical protein DIC56_17310 [Rhizobium sp.]|nr:hypothetical protein [Rhizobium sp.]